MIGEVIEAPEVAGYEEALEDLLAAGGVLEEDVGERHGLGLDELEDFEDFLDEFDEFWFGDVLLFAAVGSEREVVLECRTDGEDLFGLVREDQAFYPHK